MMKIPELAMWLLAAALIIHTIAEVWLPEWAKVSPNWQAAVFNRLLFLENLPVFIFAIATAIAGWKLPIVGGILLAVGVTHPLLDHVGLSIKQQQFRPGSRTGIFLLLPLSIETYAIGFSRQLFSLTDLVISGSIGLGISIWLLWATVRELERA